MTLAMRFNVKKVNIYPREKIRRTTPVTGRGGPCSCEMLKIPHFLHSQLTVGN
jgi:hypothetical protein